MGEGEAATGLGPGYMTCDSAYILAGWMMDDQAVFCLFLADYF